MRRNGFFKDLVMGVDESDRDEMLRKRKDRVWKDKFNYFHRSEGMSKADAEEAADEAYDAYYARHDSTMGRDVAFARNGVFRDLFMGVDESDRDEMLRKRKDRVWKDKFNYFHRSEGMSKADAEEAADEAYDAYYARHDSTMGRDVAFARNGRRGTMVRNSSHGNIVPPSRRGAPLTSAGSNTLVSSRSFKSSIDEERMRANPSEDDYEDFLGGYFEAMEFTAPEDIDDPDIARLASEAVRESSKDCKAFLRKCGDDIRRSGKSFEEAGHDFWMTRNGHGVGFWDGDWPEPYGSSLDDCAKSFREVDLYEGDDGQLYLG